MDSASHQQNRRAWDAMAGKGKPLAQPAKDDEFNDPLQTVDGCGWLGGNVKYKRLLCLAAGGGKQSVLYAAAGADVTVVDISPAMLELDRRVATERKLNVRTVEASMDNLSMFPAATFDIVIQPVSTCYVSDIGKVYSEVARVLRGDGLYISQHKQPTSLQTAIEPKLHGYELLEPYYRSGPLPAVAPCRLREAGTLEYLHRWEELIGLMCRAGFAIEDLVEPLHVKADAEFGSFGHRCQYVAPYVRIKARRREAGGEQAKVWVP